MATICCSLGEFNLDSVKTNSVGLKNVAWWNLENTKSVIFEQRRFDKKWDCTIDDETMRLSITIPIDYDRFDPTEINSVVKVMDVFSRMILAHKD